MGETGTLSPRRKRFIAALAASDSIRAAAAVVGCSESTAFRWLRLPSVRSEIARRQDAMLAQVGTGIVADMSESRLCLREVMRDKDASPSQRVTAARALLDTGLRLFDILTVADRLAVLEAKLEDYDEAHDAH